ncbi:MAG: thermonuclease family protein [Candidatus Pacebacteria bacterium]|nr:thermonuclease family protein [Candidatus Paceibacterota bacterium]
MKKILSIVFLLSLVVSFISITPNINAMQIPEGAIIKTDNNPDVYIVKYKNGKQFKRLVLNPQVFESYSHLRWRDILTVSQIEMDSFIVSDLVKVDAQTDIYQLVPNGDIGTKVLIESTVGYDLDSAYTINLVDFGNYVTGEVRGIIDTDSYPNETQNNIYTVNRVVDGDTIEVNVNSVLEKVRLLGINTRETVDPRKSVECFGIEASNKAKMVLMGQNIELVADNTQGDRDKYNRLLRYVFLEDGTNFNKMMISEGYAYEYTYNTSYKYQVEFKQAEKVAMEAKRGLWATSVCDSQSAPVSDQYNCSSNVYNCTDFSTHAEAQSAFESCGGTANDIHRLDGDNNGIACESLQ